MNSIWARWPTQALQGVYDRSLRHYHRLGKRIAAAMRRRARGPDHLVLNKAETSRATTPSGSKSTPS